MTEGAGFRCALPDPALLGQLLAAPLPAGLTEVSRERQLFRDLYLDTPDDALKRREAQCRLRLGADDRRFLTLTMPDPSGTGIQRFDARIEGDDPKAALSGSTEPARRLRGLVDPVALKPQVEIEMDRTIREGAGGAFRYYRVGFLYDLATVRSSGLSRSFAELMVRRRRGSRPKLSDVQRELEAAWGLRTSLTSKLELARGVLRSVASEAAARGVARGRFVAALAVDGASIAFLAGAGGELTLPVAAGSGEEACRHVLASRFGSRAGDLLLAGVAPGNESRGAIEVWLVRDAKLTGSGASFLALADAQALAGTPALRDADSLAALGVLARSGLLGPVPESSSPLRTSRASAATFVSAASFGAAASDRPPPSPERFLNAERSLLEFNGRVLALAEDAETPILERLRYLAIVSSNLDELYMVQVGDLKETAAAEAEGAAKSVSLDGLDTLEQLGNVAALVRPLLARQARAAELALSAAGLAVRRFHELTEGERAPLTTRFRDELFPLLVPRAVTMSPGHPFPLIPALTLCVAAVTRGPDTELDHLSILKIPPEVPRFFAVPGGVLPVEEIVIAHLARLHPGREIDAAHVFRITRADTSVVEEGAGDLLHVVEEGIARRARNAVVRLEVDSRMPKTVRDRLVKELRFERPGEPFLLTPSEIFEVEGLLDLRCLRDLAGGAELPGGSYPPFAGADPIPEGELLLDVLDRGDVLVHHPYESFDATVVRFFREAARDPDVQSMRLTLYRAGDPSPIVEALLEARARGKEVAAFVELKARFDEERNIGWVKRLEDAGASVVYGLPGLKTHAKAALVVRRENGVLRRIVHVGTGNYNAATARFYTDFGLFTKDEALGLDLNDFFNELTGSSRAPRAPFRKILVAPRTLLDGLVSRIDREAAAARAGGEAWIRAKLNGLSDARVIEALYAASHDGATVSLVVRGLCTLRPGVRGISENIRVVSILGRFLEHARVIAFANGGQPEVFIGSADFRPRNLRRRVELLAPVEDPLLKERLLRVLDGELASPAGFDLRSDGSYSRLPVSRQAT